MTESIGLIGLGVMGQNLALNAADKGIEVILYNRTFAKAQTLAQQHNRLTACAALKDFLAKIPRPRRIFLMLQAGAVTDGMLEQLLPLLDAGDCIIDGGNSHYLATQQRYHQLKEKGIAFCGLGISGGEKGARHGPSLMPGCEHAVWLTLQRPLELLAAQVDGTPCCAYLGPGGAGHFVKMVHNGIEYIDLQLYAELYHTLRTGMGYTPGDCSALFEKWEQGPLGGYLTRLTAMVLREEDADGFLIDQILDAVGQKGTGRWSLEAALTLGRPFTMMGEAVMARVLSSATQLRHAFVKQAPAPVELSVETLHQAFYTAKLLAYAQGFDLLSAASKHYAWDLPLPTIASLWRGGCIIQNALLPAMQEALKGDFWHAPPFVAIEEGIGALQQWTTRALDARLPVPVASAGLNGWFALHTDLPGASLIQGLRDAFGAHTFRTKHDPKTPRHHKWPL